MLLEPTSNCLPAYHHPAPLRSPLPSRSTHLRAQVGWSVLHNVTVLYKAAVLHLLEWGEVAWSGVGRSGVRRGGAGWGGVGVGWGGVGWGGVGGGGGGRSVYVRHTTIIPRGRLVCRGL